MTTFDAAGQALFDRITGEFGLNPAELATLENACQQTDLAARLAAELKKAPLTVPGKDGQPKPNPLLASLRATHSLIANLLLKIKLPDDAGVVAAKLAARSRINTANVKQSWTPERRHQRFLNAQRPGQGEAG